MVVTSHADENGLHVYKDGILVATIPFEHFPNLIYALAAAMRGRIKTVR